LAIGLALLASLGWGLSDFLGGLRTRTLPVRVVASGMIGGGFVTALLGAVLFSPGYPGHAVLLPGALAGLASVVAITSLYKGLAIGSMSVVAPISAAYPVVPVVFGLAQGERPSSLQFAGMALVVAGVVLASYVRSVRSISGPSPPYTLDDGRYAVVPLPDVGEGIVDRMRRGAATHQPRTVAGAALGVVAALASGTALTAISAAAETDPYWGMVLTRGVGLLGMLALVAANRTGFGVRRRQVPLLLFIGVVDTVATGLFAVASTIGFLSVVSVIASLFPIGTIMLARLALQERLQPQQNAGVAVALSGVALVALA
jgi:drug/metabolite transporter (DMT)-like permease